MISEFDEGFDTEVLYLQRTATVDRTNLGSIISALLLSHPKSRALIDANGTVASELDKCFSACFSGWLCNKDPEVSHTTFRNLLEGFLRVCTDASDGGETDSTERRRLLVQLTDHPINNRGEDVEELLGDCEELACFQKDAFVFTVRADNCIGFPLDWPRPHQGRRYHWYVDCNLDLVEIMMDTGSKVPTPAERVACFEEVIRRIKEQVHRQGPDASSETLTTNVHSNKEHDNNVRALLDRLRAGLVSGAEVGS